MAKGIYSTNNNNNSAKMKQYSKKIFTCVRPTPWKYLYSEGNNSRVVPRVNQPRLTNSLLLSRSINNYRYNHSIWLDQLSATLMFTAGSMY